MGYDTTAIERRLVKAGYGRHVIADEVHAYLVGALRRTWRRVSAAGAVTEKTARCLSNIPGS
jgi:hypothetical protein